tara:strand:+ start:6284 stop:6496 length:213 start_codon:yes stop_codon:yes gene_type:complete
MLQDFVSMELLFGRGEAVLFIDDILDHYSENDVRSAIDGGYLTSHCLCFGPDCGRHVCWLTEAGRSLVRC